MSKYNDTNLGVGMCYDSPEDKEIEKLRGRISKIKAVNADLLEALKLLYEIHQDATGKIKAKRSVSLDEWYTTAERKARAAVTKAKGEA